MKHLILTIFTLIIACNPVDVIEELKLLTSNTLVTVEYTSTIKQVTKSRSFYVSSQYLKKVVEQYIWLQPYKSDSAKGYRCYCRSFTIKRDDNLIVVRFIGSPIGKEWQQELIWNELISEKLYQEIMSYYEPIEHSYVNIYVGE